MKKLHGVRFILVTALLAICCLFAACELTGGGSGSGSGGGSGSGEVEKPIEHVHTFDTKWTTTDDFHYHAPTCGHDVKARECEGYGKHEYKGESEFCTVCRYKKPGGEPEHVCRYTEKVVEPTCAEQGYTLYTCECGDSYKDNYTPISQVHSKIVSIEAVDPTCTERGNTYGEKCELCGEVLIESVGLDPLGHHEVTDPAVPATCTTDGRTEGSHCDRCNEVLTASRKIPAAHTEIVDPARDATCASAGCTEGKHCSVCGKVFVEQTEIPALPHRYLYGKCEECGDLRFTEGLEYKLSPDKSGYIVTGMGTAKTTELVIPATYNDKPVVEIQEHAFDGWSEIISVIIPEGVTRIETYAFYGCALAYVSVPNSLTYVGDEAIAYANVQCTEHEGGLYVGCDENPYVILTGITDKESTLFIVPQETKIIGDVAFASASKLRNVRFSGDVTCIGRQAFMDCRSLTAITLPDSIEQIGYGAFWNVPPALFKSYAHGYYLGSATNPYLAFVTWADNEIQTVHKDTRIIAGGAFLSCEATKITIPAGVRTICDAAFSGTAVQTVNMEKGVTRIGAEAFSFCEQLRSIKIPDSVEYIGPAAFRDCTGSSVVDIGKGVRYIGRSAFCGTTVNEVDYRGTVGDWCKIDFADLEANPLYPADLKKGTMLRVGTYQNLLEKITEQDAIEEIKDYAFFACNTLKTVELPANVTSVGQQTFSWCPILTSVKLTGVRNIGVDAFAACSRLAQVTMTAVRRIEVGAFSGCDVLQGKNVAIGNSVECIGGDNDALFAGECTVYNNVKYIGYTSNPYAVAFGLSDYPGGTVAINPHTRYIAYPMCVDSIEGMVIEKHVTAIYDLSNNVNTIYYKGTPEEWQAVTLEDWDDTSSIRVLYFRSQKPQDSDYAYWHYVNNKATEW